MSFASRELFALAEVRWKFRAESRKLLGAVVAEVLRRVAEETAILHGKMARRVLRRLAETTNFARRPCGEVSKSWLVKYRERYACVHIMITC